MIMVYVCQDQVVINMEDFVLRFATLEKLLRMGYGPSKIVSYGVIGFY